MNGFKSYSRGRLATLRRVAIVIILSIQLAEYPLFCGLKKAFFLGIFVGLIAVALMKNRSMTFPTVLSEIREIGAQKKAGPTEMGPA